MKNSILLFSVSAVIIISLFGFTKYDNNLSYSANLDVKKFFNAAEDINSLTDNIISSYYKKESNNTEGWNDNDRQTLLSAGFNPDYFHPQELLNSKTKEFTMPEDSINDAISEWIYNGQTTNNFFGYSVASAGDVNGDGFSDIIAGSYYYNTGTGRAYIFYGGLYPHVAPDIILTGDSVNIRFGISVASAGDVNGDGYSDVLIGAYSYNSNRGKAYIFFGGVNMDNTPDVIFTGESLSSYFGRSVSSAGDVNGDGYSDVIVGAYNYSSGTGKAYLFYGGLNMNNVADVIFTGESPSVYFGRSVSSAGDVNGDGYDDVIVGSSNYNSQTGRAYIFYGGINMNNTADVIFTGESTANFFGYSVSSAGDVNGDGYSDVIIGAYGYNSSTGKAYLYFGSPAMDNSADVTLSGELAGDYFGYSVSSAGDINGDGFSDVIAGANEHNSSTGKAYVFYGGLNMNNTADVYFNGENSNDNFGYSVSSAGDVNGDGYCDILIGAPFHNSNTGRVHIYLQSMTGTDLSDLKLSDTTSPNNHFGCSVASAGDLNGDGYQDIIVGADYYDSIGRAYIYFGGIYMDDISDVIFTGAANHNFFGCSVSSAGDVNGDGYSDVIVGASGYNSNTGRAYIYFGGSNMNNTADVILTGSSGRPHFGISVSSAGDVNGDGYSDVIVGAYNFNEDPSSAYIYFGGSNMNNTADVILTGPSGSPNFGISVSSAGDVNGDSFSDVIVGNVQADDNYGRAYIYYGGSNMNNTADVIMAGEAAGSYYGHQVSGAGDLNGDGYDDVIVGAQFYSVNYVHAGKAYVYFGGALMDSLPDLTMTGDIAHAGLGASVSSAGDVNGDGYADIIVGSDTYNNLYGRASVYFGGINVDNIPDVIMTGLTNNNFGYSVAGAGDANGDGLDDIVVGAYSYADTIESNAYVFLSANPPVKPTLNSVRDVPNDEGGKVKLTFARSGYDIPGINKITLYRVERRIPPSIIWGLIANITASNNPYYTYTASTPFDSGNGLSGIINYRIIARTSSLTQYWVSNIVSGYSVDNLPPAKVTNLAGTMDSVKIDLHWRKNTEEDLDKYKIYRNNVFFAESTDTTLNDSNVFVDSTYKYKVSAVDIHGNEGPKSDSLQFVFGELQLNLTVLIQGFYDNVSGLMVKDTVTVLLKNVTSPYSTVDSVRIFLDSLGQGTMKLSNAIRNETYYIVIKHRNTIETWSTAGGLLFDKSINSYDFTTAITQAYGSNLLLNGTKWCIISGDANQDGSIDALDRSACWNDRNLSGYYASDLNGDGVVDALDRSIAWNNRNLSVQKPALVASPNNKLGKQNDKVIQGISNDIYDLKLDGSKSKIKKAEY